MLWAAEVKVNAAEESQNGSIFVDENRKGMAYGFAAVRMPRQEWLSSKMDYW
jgi:hypothetical protein